MTQKADSPAADDDPVIGTGAWWRRRRAELLEIGSRRENAWVYDADTIAGAVTRLRGLGSVDRILFAMKANWHAGILGLLAELGVDFECVSPWEIEHLLDTVPSLDRERILFTPNFAPRADYEWAFDRQVRLTLDNLYPLRHWPDLFRGADLFVRIDPGLGRGHHQHVVTSGEHSKFGIPRFELDELGDRVSALDIRVSGIHAHSGSGIPEADTWGTVATVLAEVAGRFPHARVLDLGGGIGVPSRPGDTPFNLAGMDDALRAVRSKFPDYEVWIEPGRYLVAEAGVLLTHVTQLKGKGERRYVGVSAGMNALIRPALYDAYHHIVNLTRLDEPPTQIANVVGPVCETGDTLGRDRELPDCRENDVMLILTAGAYGRSMSSQYNLRPTADEILLPRL